MRDYPAERIRNVILISHGGAGKTSLCEAMLFNSGVINRLGKVDEGNTTSDYEPEEVKRKISIGISLLPLEWDETKINLIDSPGYADFMGEVKAGLRVADGAVVVVCAAAGVEVGTELVWKYADEQKTPRIIFINKIDRENADFYRTLEQLQASFGAKCTPIQLPIGSQAGFQGVVDLITLKVIGEAQPEEDIPSSLKDQVARFREKLVEAAAETDDELIAKYLESEELTEDEIRQALRIGTAAGKIVPVLVGSSLQNKGTSPVLSAICDYLPSPKDDGKLVIRNLITQEEETIELDAGVPLAALVFKTTADPYVGKLTYLRVYASTLYSDSSVWNATKSRVERIGQLFLVRGKNQEPVSHLIAGDIGAVAKLTETTTGDSLCNQDHPLALVPIEFPIPILSMAVHPKAKSDLDKLGSALTRLSEEDPTLHVRKEPDTGETILSGIGESHLEIAAERMQRKFGVNIAIDTPKVPYKETITILCKSEYKHKKQTGGHGQYGHVFLELEPLPRGAGFEFAKTIVGGAVPKNYIPAVEKGVRESLQEGVLANYPITDLKVTLYDGSYHSVDSSDISFKIAGAHALRQGMAQAQPVLLEPIMSIRVAVPDNFTGDTIGGLNSKRAKVLNITPQGGVSIIEAQAPLAELLRYATVLRSITQGRGSYTIEFSHYEEVPPHITQQIISESKKTAGKT